MPDKITPEKRPENQLSQPEDQLSIRVVARAHPITAATWLLPPVIILTASNAPADHRVEVIGWGLFIAIIALAWTAFILASAVLQRMVQVFAMFTSDVPRKPPLRAVPPQQRDGKGWGK